MNKQQIAAKNYLMRAYRIDNRINSKLDQIAALNDMATRPVGSKTGAPSSVQNREMEDGGINIRNKNSILP